MLQLKQGSIYAVFIVFYNKNWSFFELRAVSKKLKLKGKFSDIGGKIICRLFHMLEQFPFTASEMGLDYYH